MKTGTNQWRGRSSWIVFSLVLTVQAHADNDLASNRLLPWYLDGNPGWQLDVGLELGWEPDYVGSDDNELEPFPSLAVHYVAGDQWRFRLTPMTLGAVWDVRDGSALQLVIEYEEGREASETKDLKALADGEDTLEAELTFAQRLGRSGFLYATYQPEIQDRGKGVVWFVGAGQQHRLGERWLLTPTIDLSWGDSEHMQTEFGVSSTDASTLGVEPYRAKGGLKSSTASLNVQWDWTPRLTLLANLSLEYYFDKAAKSPLIDDIGSRLSKEAEIALVYTF